jgi:hypothetical protein
MKREVYIFILGLLSLAACADNVVEKPENLIPKDVMVDVYYDISILNGLKSTGADKLERIDLDPDTFLFEKYGIDSTQLAKSSIFYTSNAALQLEMFTEVEARLQRLKDTIDARREREQKRKTNNKPQLKKATEKS